MPRKVTYGPHGTTLLDDFDRPDVNPLDGNWLQTPGGAAMEIAGNLLQTGNSPPASGTATWLTPEISADCEAWITAVNRPSTDELSLLVRATDKGTFTLDAYEGTLASDGTLTIGRRDAGTFVFLASASVSWQNGDGLALSAIGNILTGWLRRENVWYPQVSAEDTTYPGAGYHSLKFFTDAGALTWDDFGAGPIPPTSIDRVVDNSPIYRTRGG